MTIAKIPMLYHFTDRRNLASICELGGLYSLTKLNEMGVQITFLVVMTGVTMRMHARASTSSYTYVSEILTRWNSGLVKQVV